MRLRVLLKRTLEQQLTGEQVRVAAPESVRSPRSHGEARELGRELGAGQVLWGNAGGEPAGFSVHYSYTIVMPKVGASAPDRWKLQSGMTSHVAQFVAAHYYLFNQKDPEMARLVAEKISPPTPESLLLRGAASYEKKDWPKAESLLTLAVAADPHNVFYRNKLGNTYLVQKEYERATEEYEKAIERDPKFAPPYVNLGLIHKRQHNYHKAIEYYKKAQELDPNSPRSYNNMGNVYYRLGRYTEAIEQFQMSISLAPEYNYPHNGLGNVYRDQRKYAEAAKEYAIAVELAPESPIPHYNLGILYERQDQSKQAMREYKSAIELDPDYPPPYRNLAYRYFVHSEYDSAMLWITQFIGLQPESAEGHRVMGHVFAAQDSVQRSIEQYWKAIELDPGDLSTHVFLFLGVHRIGNKRDAYSGLEGLPKSVNGDAWLNQVVLFFAGEVSQNALLLAADDDGEVCEALYYLGIACLLGVKTNISSSLPDTAKAKEYFERCVATEMTSSVEYWFAKIELQRIGPR